MDSTLSFHMGTSFNEAHNNRTIPVPHADKEYEDGHNWYSPNNMSLEGAYELLFGEEFRRYNASVRADRRYNSYLEKLQIACQKEKEKIAQLRHSGAPSSQIRRNKNAVKPAYEIIIGLPLTRSRTETILPSISSTFTSGNCCAKSVVAPISRQSRLNNFFISLGLLGLFHQPRRGAPSKRQLPSMAD